MAKVWQDSAFCLLRVRSVLPDFHSDRAHSVKCETGVYGHSACTAGNVRGGHRFYTAGVLFFRQGVCQNGERMGNHITVHGKGPRTTGPLIGIVAARSESLGMGEERSEFSERVRGRVGRFTTMYVFVRYLVVVVVVFLNSEANRGTLVPFN